MREFCVHKFDFRLIVRVPSGYRFREVSRRHTRTFFLGCDHPMIVS